MTHSKAKPATVNVKKIYNTAYAGPENEATHPACLYRVDKAVNTLVVEPGERLKREVVQALIDDGITVNVS